MKKLLIVKLCFFLCCSIALSNCQCALNFPYPREIMPRYNKIFGKKIIQVPYTTNGLILQEGEKITGYCANTFTVFQDYIYHWETHEVRGKVNFTLHCENRELHYNNNRIHAGQALSCIAPKWQVYETDKHLPWCQPNAESYVLASKFNLYDLVLAAACVDVEQLSLRSFQYFTGPKSLAADHNNLQNVNSSAFNELKLGEEIVNFYSIFTPSNSILVASKIFMARYPNNLWAKLATYEYDSLVQGGPYIDYLKSHGPLLDIIWWSNLRNFNWKRFTNALDEHANNYTYNLHAGTSGKVHLPESNECTQRDFVELQFGEENKTIPAYIWTYVQATDGSEEFVVVGYNSPFYDFFDEDDLILCKDICDQISWLKDIRSTFRYSTLGVIFCCSVDDVRQHDILDYFPIADVNAETNSYATNGSYLTLGSLSNAAATDSNLTNGSFVDAY